MRTQRSNKHSTDNSENTQMQNGNSKGEGSKKQQPSTQAKAENYADSLVQQVPKVDVSTVQQLSRDTQKLKSSKIWFSFSEL